MFKRLLFLLTLFTGLFSFGQSFNSIWDTSQPGTSGNNEITIPTNPGYTYNYDVDWGDGMNDTNVTGDITHTYATPGLYTVSISGDFPAIYFNDTGDRQKIIEILVWGTIQWQTMEDAFHGCVNLNFDAIDNPDLSQVTSLRNMFRDATSFNGIVNGWDVSTITDMSGLFARATTFNRPLDLWNTINVTDMSETFSSANNFNEPLDNWNTASVTNMSSMFSSASSFSQNINNWDVSQVTDMSGTFRNTGNFDQPLNNWNVGNVTDMSYMFNNSDFNRPIATWNVSQVTTMRGMFGQAQFNQPIENWNVSAVTDMSEMFQRNRTFNQPLNNWNVSNVTNMASMFDGWFWDQIYNLPLNNWDVSNVTNMEYMFRDNSAFNQDISGWDVSAVTNMRGMFQQTDVFNQNIGAWNVSGVSNMSSMFQQAQAFNQPLNSWNIANVANLSSMFSNAPLFNQPLDTWDLTNVTELQSMFNLAEAFNQDISGWNVSGVSNMSNVFNQATSFDQNLASWNITNVTNMTNMLSNSGISQENYDFLLIGWATQAVNDNVNLGATNLTYCDGLNARQELIDDHNWSFTGDSVNCSFVLCTEITMPAAGDTMTPANSDIRWNPAPNATGYRITLEIERGGVRDYALIGGNQANNLDVGNVVGLDFTNEFQAGDIVYVTVVPYNAEGPATGCTEISFTVVDSWVNSPDAFKLTYDTTLQNGTFTTPVNQLLIETSPGLTYDYSIDWGDGQYDNNVTNDITHTYLTPGIYTISIIGTFPAPRHEEFNSDGYKLISIDQWGTYSWESMSGAFAGCQNMFYNATDIPDLSNVTDMSRMFIVCYNFNGNINNWDVSNVTNMFATFGVTTSFDQPLNNWDVSNVTNMSLMFFRTDVFNQDIGNWNTSNVTSMQRMFEDADAFNQSINNWNVSNVTDMNQMFQRAQVFNQPLNNWDVSSVLDMEEMFDNAGAFNQNIDNWDVSSVVGMGEMFDSATAFNQPLNSWNVSSVDDMSSMFRSATSFNQPLGNWDVSSVTTMNSMFSGASNFNQNLNNWNVTNVTDMSRMFSVATSFNQPLNNWDVNSVVNMSSMFQGADVFNQSLDNWNVSAVANMTSMFQSAVAFDQPINTWDVSSVTLMESMFEDASAFNQELGNWNVSVVTDFEAMFKDAILFDRPLNSWDTGEALTMREMFDGATEFNQNIDGWNTSFVTNMESMFRNAETYDQDMDSWNVASVTTMQNMFQDAILFNGNIGSWNVRAVLTMENMFRDATAFNQNINNWRVSGVANMNYMFRNATTYNQPMEQWDIGAVSMRSMFEDATAFNQYLGDWDVSNVSNMQNMLDDTALSRENYDNTLIAWSEQTLTPGINLGANTLLYCDALEERQSMIDNFGWSFSGDVLDCPIPQCTQLVSPLNGAIDVPVNTNLTWEAILYANGYRLTVGTTPGGNDLVNGDVINDTFYEFATDFTGGETVFVTLVPFNDTGDALGPCAEESFTIANSPATVPDCTNLTSPLNGATDVVIDTDLSWNPISNADSYILTVGTTTGGNDILDNEDVGNVTTYDLPTDLPEDIDIFVTIVPYNAEGNADPCTEESFRTEIIPVPPACTTLTNPLDGTTGVPIDTNISWNPVDGATGYLVVVGDTQGGIEIANNIDVGNVTTYDFPADLQEDRTHYVTIIPYNDVGDAMGCTEESFRTGSSTLNDPPACTTLLNPLNGSMDVPVDTDLSWNAAANTNGYYITVGTTAGGNDILDNEDVGNVTTYDLPADLPDVTTIFVTVVPYNSFGNASGCGEESFTTALVSAVACTRLTEPLNGATDVSIFTDILWEAEPIADGYYVTIGTTSGGSDIADNIDVGNALTFDIPTNLPLNTEIFVTIVPYDSVGSAIGCTEESFTTEATLQPPTCSRLMGPDNGDINVPIDTDLAWDPIPNVNGYLLTVTGSTSTVNNLVNEDVSTGAAYDLPGNFDNGEIVTVLIVPYNDAGQAIGCTEESFTIVSNDPAPQCTTLSNPTAGAANISISTDLSWNASSDADGYRLTVGTTDGGNDILDNIDVGNVLTYDLLNDLPQNAEIFISIIPYNTTGDAIGCTQESFITETVNTLPECTNLSMPLHLMIDVPVDTNLTWDAVSQVEGYRLTVGTSPGLGDILNNEDVGTVTTYDLPIDLPENTEIFVFVQPYNNIGDAEFCEEESFITGTAPLMLPNCTGLAAPENGSSNVAVNTSISWNEVPEAIGYRVTVGTSSGGNDILNNEDVGLITSYDFATDLPYEQQIFVAIIAYNSDGDAEDCEEESFITVQEPLVESFFGFSPDGDGNNDFWTINGIEDYPENTVMIYNRWGDMIFKVEGYDNASNVFAGEANQLIGMGAGQLPEGTYFFQIIIPQDHNLKTTQGYLVLKR